MFHSVGHFTVDCIQDKYWQLKECSAEKLVQGWRASGPGAETKDIFGVKRGSL